MNSQPLLSTILDAETMAKKKTGKIPTLMKHLTSQCKDTKIKKTEFQSDNDANKKIKLGDMKETKLEATFH